MRIAFAAGSMMNIRLESKDMTLVELKNYFKVCQQGGKHEAYFIRGGDIEEVENHVSSTGKEWGTGTFRSDKYLRSAEFLIIDGDNGFGGGNAPDPKDMSEALKDMGIAFILYTTHSHSKTKNKFRVVIPANRPFDKGELKPTMDSLLERLIKAEVGVEPVKEMYTWSQPWFVPTRDEPDDGLFEFYSDMSGDDYVVQKEPVGNTINVADNIHSSQSDVGHSSDIQSIDEIISIIKNGSDGLHFAINKYIIGKVKDGITKAEVFAVIRSWKPDNLAPEREMYFSARELERSWNGAKEKESVGSDIVALELGKIVKGIEKAVPVENGRRYLTAVTSPPPNIGVQLIEWPPGLLGEVSRACYAFSPYPNQIISIVASIGFLAGTGGRRNNINGLGCNLYQMLVMGTSEGKDVIRKFITRILSDTNLMGGDFSFMGARRYTAGKGLIRHLSAERCLISVLSEAGFMMQSKSGDPANLKGVTLNLFGTSGHDDIYTPEFYSSEKESIDAVRAPCWSCISESTPESLHEGMDYQQATATGELPRNWIFEAVVETTDLNEEMVYDIGDLKDKKSLIVRLSKWIRFCVKTTHDDDPLPVHHNVTRSMLDFVNEQKAKAKECKESGDLLKASMLARTGANCLKLSALMSAANRPDVLETLVKDNTNMDVDQDCWRWVTDVWQPLMFSGLNSFFKNDGRSGLEDIVFDHMTKPMAKIVRIDPEMYRKESLSKAELKNYGYTFKVAVLKRVLKNCKPINKMDSTRFGRSGLDIILEYMIKQNYIKVGEVRGYRSITLKPDFISLIKLHYS